MDEGVVRNSLLAVVEELSPTVLLTEGDCDTALTDLGFDSLDQAGFLLRIDEDYGIKIPDEQANQLQSINDYVRHILNQQAK